jgi:hypothetical protein
MTGTRGFRNPKNWSQDWTGRSIKKKKEGKVKVRTGIKGSFQTQEPDNTALNPHARIFCLQSCKCFFQFSVKIWMRCNFSKT